MFRDIKQALTPKYPFLSGAGYAKIRRKGRVPVDNVVLIGMPGSGKSTVGVLLAKALGYGFLDVDLVIQQREGALLQELLDTRGVEAFLDAEEAAVRSVACGRCVVAPGGSAVCREKAALHLKSLGPVVYLRVPLEELNSRIRNLSTRGIAMEPGQTLADVMAFRAPLYERYADLVIDCPAGQALAQTARLALERLRAAYPELFSNRPQPTG